LKAADAASFLVEKLQEIAEATGDAKLKEFADQLGAVTDLISSAAQGFAQGGVVGAIVGAATSVIEQTINSIAIAKAEEAEFQQNQLDFINAYHIKLLEIKDEDYESVFGVRGIEKASDAIKIAKKSITDYKEYIDKTSGPGEEQKTNTSTGVGFALGFGGASMGVNSGFLGFKKEVTTEFKEIKAAYEKGYNDLQAMAVKTKDYSGWSNFWGKQDKFTSLKDLAKEIWDDDGQFNVEAARTFLETNTQISDEQRAQIQLAIDLGDKYGEALAVIDDQISNIFSSLSEDMTDAIFDSVRNGADAWDLFEDAGVKVIDSLGKELVQELFIQSYLDSFTDRMREAYSLESIEDTQKELGNIMSDIFGGLGTVLEGASQAAKEWDERAKEQGWDMSKLETTFTSPLAGAIKGASQEEVNALIGYMNNTMINQSEETDLIRDQMRILTSIDGKIAVSNQFLESIDGKLTSKSDPLRAQGIQ